MYVALAVRRLEYLEEKVSGDVEREKDTVQRFGAPARSGLEIWSNISM